MSDPLGTWSTVPWQTCKAHPLAHKLPAQIILQSAARRLSAEVSYACEKTKFKREFYRKVIEPKCNKAACLYEDVLDLSRGLGKCVVHDTNCALCRDIDNLACGFS
jgi:hypothetical protein